MFGVVPGTKASKSAVLHARSSPCFRICAAPEVPAQGEEGAGSGPVVPVPLPSSAAHPAPSLPGNVRQQYVGPPAAQQGAKVQAACHGEQPGPGGSHSGLHEPAGDDLQHVRPHAQAEVVRLDRRLLFLH